MKKLVFILALFLTGAFSAIPAIAQTTNQFEDLPLTAESCFEFEVFDPILQTCVIECDSEEECSELEALLDELLADINYGYEGGEREEGALLVSYRAEGSLLSDPVEFNTTADFLDVQANTELHQSIWSRFLLIAPERFAAAHISSFEVFSDGLDGDFAYVVQDPENPEMWILGVDPIDARADAMELDYTLIHELAHLITLESDQVTPSLPVFEATNDPEISEDEYWEIFGEESANCEHFFLQEGCANEDAYINRFFFRFWTDIYPERLTFDPGDIEREQEFFETYRDQFFTQYAVTNPGEDIAESFTAFVLLDRTGATTIAEQKINFFYDYPELVDLRQQIRLNIASDLSVPEEVPTQEEPAEETTEPAEEEETQVEEEKPVKVEQTFEDIVRGRILLQVQANGEAWYVDPTNLRRYFLGRPADAFRIMRSLALGVTNANLLKIKQAGGGDNTNHDREFAKGLAGRILLQVEGNGEAWYVHPMTYERHYLGRPEDAFNLMRKLGLGITTADLEVLTEGTIE